MLGNIFAVVNIMSGECIKTTQQAVYQNVNTSSKQSTAKLRVTAVFIENMTGSIFLCL